MPTITPCPELIRRIPIVDEPKVVVLPDPPKVPPKPVKRVRKPRKPVERIKRPRKPSSRVYVLKTHCINGHELVEGNLYYPKSGRRKRECRACIINRHKKYRNKQKK